LKKVKLIDAKIFVCKVRI